MKVIEILNKIANGEEVPKIIKYDDFTYWYDETEKDYYRYIGYDLDNDDVEYLINGGFISDILNDEVEIIEEYNKEIAGKKHAENNVKLEAFINELRYYRKHLNNEIEEKKEIPEKLDIRQEKNIKNNWKWKVYGKEHSYNISTPQKIIADKINEIIDYLKSKGE